MKSILPALRFVAILVIAAAILAWIAQHRHGRAKGTPIPIPNVALCLVIAGVAGSVCKRYWLPIAVPFVAGIAGAFGIFEPHSGPYGGILGLLVGCLVLLLPFGRRRRVSSEETPGPA